MLHLWVVGQENKNVRFCCLLFHLEQVTRVLGLSYVPGPKANVACKTEDTSLPHPLYLPKPMDDNMFECPEREVGGGLWVSEKR